MQNSVVRIRNKSGATVGAGVYLAEAKVVTCAHVITSVLEISGNPDLPEIKAESIDLDFPLISGDTCTATIESWDSKADIACLRINNYVPATAEVMPLINSNEFWGHPCRVFGFPPSYEIGVWASGVLRAKNNKNWIQLQNSNSTGYRIQSGFSGSPVFDEILGGIIGIIVAVDIRSESAFVIPSHVIAKTFPESNFDLLEVTPYQRDVSNQVLEKSNPRKLRTFLCHASGDKPVVRDLYRKLVADGVSPWLDEEDLLPGQKWQMEIPKAVRNSDAVIVCISSKSVVKTGFVQKEIRYALDAAEERPEGSIFLIPLRLDECEVQDRLREWHWVDLFAEYGYERLIRALQKCAETLNVNPPYLRQEDKGEVKHRPLYIRTRDTLLSIPFRGNEQERKALVYLSGLDDVLISHINFSGPQVLFISRLIQTLSAWGQLRDGRLAIAALLETSKGFIGDAGKRKIDTLIKEWNELKN